MAESSTTTHRANGSLGLQNPMRQSTELHEEAVDDGESFPRKKRRKLPVDERKRAVRACDGCRKMKEKCEGGQPCRRCTHLRRKCEFSELPPRDLVPSALYKQSDGSPDDLSSRLKYLEGILKAKSPTLALDTDSLRRKYDELQSPRRSTSKGHSEAGEDEDDMNLEDENIEIRPVDHNVTHYSGEFSYWNFSMKLKKDVQDWIANPHDRKGSKDLPEYWRPSELSLGTSNIKSAIQSLPPPHIAEFLISVFFKYAQRNYFYVDRRWLSRQVDVAYNDPWSSSIKDPGTVAIIFGVFAVGTQYAHMDARSKYREAVPSEDEVGTMFYQTATRLLPEVIQTSSLESVQAVLLLALYALPLDASGLSYVYYSLAIRLAIQNGMHRKYHGTELSAVAIETRNRVWWTACSVEKKIGVFHGRPMSVLRSDVDADFPKAVPEMPDEEGPLSIDRMVISIKLIHYLEDFMTEIQNLRKREKKELTNVVNHLATMKTDLTRWWVSIPEKALNVDRNSDGQAFRSCMHLRLLYCLIRMFIGRPFLFTGGRYSAESPSSPPGARKGPANSSDGHDPPSRSARRENSTTSSTTEGKKRPSRRLALVQGTIDAAVEALELCRSLHDGNEGLARASYIEYSSCRASMLALIAFSIQEQTDQYRAVMQKGLEMVREMSTAGNSAKAESTLIEALERAVARLQMFSAGRQRTQTDIKQVHKPAKPTQISNYDRFKHWQKSRKKDDSAPDSQVRVPNTSSMPPPGSAWDQNPPQQQVALESMVEYPPQFNVGDAAANNSTGPATTGYIMPTHGPGSVSDSGTADMIPNYLPPGQDSTQADPAEATFFQTLNGMPDIVPSAAAVNGWLTQARPERQLLDHFLSLPDGEFEGMALGWSPLGNSGATHGQNGSSNYETDGTLWYDIPGSGNGGGHLPGFGGW